MPRASTSTGVELEYETFGDDGAPAMVLVMGFAQQLVAWDPAFCALLAARGFRVVRFDNRDVGKSTHLAHAGVPDFFRAMQGDRAAAPYGVEEMADDVDALIVALGVPAAHLVGVSMGGFIVQETVIRHPGRVLSVASIMSSTGNRAVGHASPEALAMIFAPAPTERSALVEHALAIGRVIGSPKFRDEARSRVRAGDAWDRDHDAAGVARQAAAIVTQRNRTEDLGKVRAPTVVLHGEVDPLIAPSGGEATAAAIPGARYVLVPDMGHDLPEALWPVLVDAIVDNARRAGA